MNIKRGLKKTALTLLAIGIFVGFGAYLASTHNLKAMQELEQKTAITKADTVEEFFTREVEQYKNSPEFKAEKEKAEEELKAQLHELAKLRVENAFYTRMEQME